MPAEPLSPEPRTRVSTGASPSRAVFAIACAATVAVYLQLIIGATMRHYRAGLAIPDLPLAYGHWLPPLTQSALDAVNHQRVWNLNLEAVTFAQVWLHFAHRVGAIVVSVALLSLIAMILKRH